MQDERSSRNQRRVLVLGMCLSYLGFLATLWYIWNAPRQWFDTVWLRFGANRFTLIAIPLVVFCVCYFKLSCISGDMLKLRGRQLDERRRMVRDSAHRTAYRIVTFLCLLIPIYLAAQGLFANTQATPAPTTSHTINPVFATDWIEITPGSVHSVLANTAMTWVEASVTSVAASKDFLRLHPAIILTWQDHNSLLLNQQVHNGLITPPVVNSPHASLYPGIYYSLVLLTLLLIVNTLPKAIIAWKER